MRCFERTSSLAESAVFPAIFIVVVVVASRKRRSCIVDAIDVVVVLVDRLVNNLSKASNQLPP